MTSPTDEQLADAWDAGFEAARDCPNLQVNSDERPPNPFREDEGLDDENLRTWREEEEKTA